MFTYKRAPPLHLSSFFTNTASKFYLDLHTALHIGSGQLYDSMPAVLQSISDALNGSCPALAQNLGAKCVGAISWQVVFAGIQPKGWGFLVASLLGMTGRSKYV